MSSAFPMKGGALELQTGSKIEHDRASTGSGCSQTPTILFTVICDMGMF